MVLYFLLMPCNVLLELYAMLRITRWCVCSTEYIPEKYIWLKESNKRDKHNEPSIIWLFISVVVGKGKELGRVRTKAMTFTYAFAPLIYAPSLL